jgi:hypothetical protein
MEKTITISGIEVKLRTSAALPRMYRIMFGEDLFTVFLGLQNIKEGEIPTEALSVVENLAYCMAVHGGDTHKDITEWLAQFNLMDLYGAFPEILNIWNAENEQLSTPKKENEQ